MAFGHDGGREKRRRAGQSPAPTLRLPKAYMFFMRGDVGIAPYAPPADSKTLP